MIGFVDAVKMFYQRYAEFDGRSARAEYWWVQLFYLIAVIILAIPVILSSGSDGEPSVLSIIPLGLFILAGILPMIAVTVRRFHDQDKSGWFYLLNFIPYAGGFIILVFMCIKGTDGMNQYGPDPLGGTERVFD